jgi:hypothetical protein
MERINEFNNSPIAYQKNEVSDRKITLIATTVVFVLLVGAFKYAIGG